MKVVKNLKLVGVLIHQEESRGKNVKISRGHYKLLTSII